MIASQEASTTSTLTYGSYPHIIHAAAQYASTTTLLSLRATCRDLCTLVDSLLCEHLLLFGEDTSELRILAPDGRVPAMTPRSWWDWKSTRKRDQPALERAFKALESVRVVDMFGIGSVAFVPVVQHLTSVRVLRLFPDDPGFMTYRTHIRAEKMVVFAETNLGYHRTVQATPPLPCDGVRKLVVHMVPDPQKLRVNLSSVPSTLEHVVLYFPDRDFTPRTSDGIRAVVLPGTDAATLYEDGIIDLEVEQFRDALDILAAAYAHKPIRITVVGIEKKGPFATARIRDHIESLNLNRAPSSSEGTTPRPWAEIVTVLDYHASMSKQDVALETTR